MDEDLAHRIMQGQRVWTLKELQGSNPQLLPVNWQLVEVICLVLFLHLSYNNLWNFISWGMWKRTYGKLVCKWKLILREHCRVCVTFFSLLNLCLHSRWRCYPFTRSGYSRLQRCCTWQVHRDALSSSHEMEQRSLISWHCVPPPKENKVSCRCGGRTSPGIGSPLWHVSHT